MKRFEELVFEQFHKHANLSFQKSQIIISNKFYKFASIFYALLHNLLIVVKPLCQ